MRRERVLVVNQTRESVLSLSADVADRFVDRWCGLALGSHLRPGGGLLIRDGRFLHTLGIASRVDVVCLDHGSQVVEIHEGLLPFHLRWLSDQISGFLGLPAHTIRDSQTEVGDELAITDTEEVPPVLAMYANGGPVESHVVQELDRKGAFLKTQDRWYPGTVVDMTLKYDNHYAKLTKMGKDGRDTVRVRAKVVGAEQDGVRVEFVFLKRAEKVDFKRFARRV